MAALDMLEKLNGADFRSLTPLQRILLITDGTLTDILEAHFLEPIELVKLSQQVITASVSQTWIKPKIDEKLLERKILLCGKASGKNYVYAESVIAYERLNSSLRDELLNSDIPMGRLWIKHRLETFKEFLEIRQQPAGDLHNHFGCDAASPMLKRSYSVDISGKTAMIISEYFPA